jgi:hypothetical protein
MRFVLRAHGTEMLIPKCDELLSKYASNVNLRRYILDEANFP